MLAGYGLLTFVAVLITGNASHCIGMAEQTAQTVAFHQVGTAVGKHPFGQLIVVVVMILLGTAQHVGNFGITFVIGKTPFLAQRSPVTDHFAEPAYFVLVGIIAAASYQPRKNASAVRLVWWQCGKVCSCGWA